MVEYVNNQLRYAMADKCGCEFLLITSPQFTTESSLIRALCHNLQTLIDCLSELFSNYYHGSGNARYHRNAKINFHEGYTF